MGKEKGEICLCACDCGREAPRGKHYCRGHLAKLKATWDKKCACGCGQVTTPGADWVWGHNSKTPEFREARRLYEVDRWRDPAMREKERERAISQWNRPGVREEASRRSKEYYREHPEVGEAHSEWMKKYYEEHPEKLSEMSEKLTEYFGEHPEVGEAHSEWMKKYYEAHPEKRESFRERINKYWSDPNNREDMSVKLTEYWADPLARKQQSERKLRYFGSFAELSPTISYGTGWGSRLRRSIRERDGHCCILCGRTDEVGDRELSVHHIDYNKSNNDPCNLVTLCVSCHMKTNFNRSRWIQFFREELIESGTDMVAR